MAELGKFNRDDDLPALIACGARVLKISDLDNLLHKAEDQEVPLLDVESPFKFAKHISRIALRIGPAKTQEGQAGLDFTGSIQLTKPVSESKVDTLVDKFYGRGFRSTESRNRSIKVEQAGTYNAFRMEHVLGMAVLMFLWKEKKGFTVTNNYKEPLGDKLYRPMSIGAMEGRAQLTAFADCFFHTLDYVAHLNEDNPNHRFVIGTYVIPYLTKPNATEDSEPLKKPESTDEILEQEWRQDTTEITLDDIGGLEVARERLREIVTSYDHPEILEKWGSRRPSGVLLHGPAGTGKTMLMKALANEMGAEVWEIQSSDIYNKWLGNSEKNVKEIFTKARKHPGKLVLLFDEFDAIISIADDNTGGGIAHNNVAGLFKQEMNTLYEANPNVLIAAATNDLDRIDPAIRRRFDYVLSVPLPDQKGRLQIISSMMTAAMKSGGRVEYDMFAADVDVPRFAELMDGYSGAAIAEVMRRLSFAKALEEARKGSTTPISQADIEQAITVFKQA